jgi:hypothetical protein
VAEFIIVDGRPTFPTSGTLRFYENGMWHLMWQRIMDISEVPTDRDLRIAVIVEKYVHELPFPCRRVGFTWVASNSRKPVVVYPTHWQEWPDER